MPRTEPVANLAVSYLAKCAELRAARASQQEARMAANDRVREALVRVLRESEAYAAINELTELLGVNDLEADTEENIADALLASPAPKVTDEMVEAAAKAQYELEHTDLPWERCGDIFANGYRDDARVVLTAALRAAQGREG